MSRPKKNTINIFDYIDFRKYLSDYYIYHKEHSRFFSYRYFSEKAGFSSHNVLKMVINGQRNIALDSIEKFASVLNLSERENAYFRLLVLFCQSKNEKEKNELFREMFKFRNVAEAKKIDKLHYNFYSDWYNVVIREMINLEDFNEDYNLIGRSLSPSIRPHQVKKALKTLEETGFIKRDDNGKWFQCDPVIKTEPEVNSLAVRNYNRTMIQHAEKAIEEIDPGRREISAMTVAVSEPMFAIIKEKIQRFKDELLSDIALDSRPSEDVYQINFQFFPLLKKDRKEK